MLNNLLIFSIQLWPNSNSLHRQHGARGSIEKGHVELGRLDLGVLAIGEIDEFVGGLEEGGDVELALLARQAPFLPAHAVDAPLRSVACGQSRDLAAATKARLTANLARLLMVG